MTGQDKASHIWWYRVTSSLQAQADRKADQIFSSHTDKATSPVKDLEDLRLWFLRSVLDAYRMHRPNGPQDDGEVIPNTVRTALLLQEPRETALDPTKSFESKSK